MKTAIAIFGLALTVVSAVAKGAARGDELNRYPISAKCIHAESDIQFHYCSDPTRAIEMRQGSKRCHAESTSPVTLVSGNGDGDCHRGMGCAEARTVWQEAWNVSLTCSERVGGLPRTGSVRHAALRT